MINRTISGTADTFSAVVRVPGDKSLSHRALLFAGMAQGDSLVTGLGTGLDIETTASALRQLGVEIHGDRVRSPGVAGWSQPAHAIDCGNSGTTMRLLAGVLSTSSVSATLTGDASLTKRTMQRLEDPPANRGRWASRCPLGRRPHRPRISPGAFGVFPRGAGCRWTVPDR